MSPAGDILRVLVVDDHPLFRMGLRTRLEAEPGLAVVGEAGTGTEAVALAARSAPDVVLMDLALPDLDGLEATRRILAADPGVAVIILTMSDDDSVLGAVRVGARGYLLKGASGEETVRAIRAVAAGQTVLGAAPADRLRRHVAGGGTSGPFPGLSERELAVLGLLARGYTNPAIARRLALSPKTVRNYVSAVLAKIGAGDRHDAAELARRAGLGDGS